MGVVKHTVHELIEPFIDREFLQYGREQSFKPVAVIDICGNRRHHGHTAESFRQKVISGHMPDQKGQEHFNDKQRHKGTVGR